MNIRSTGMWPEDLDDGLTTISETSLAHLFELRTTTYRGFAFVEKSKGLLEPEMSLTSVKGQEAIRILTQRGFEELVEAIDSSSRDHFLEELIDSVNYFWVLAVLDPDTPLQKIKEVMVDQLLIAEKSQIHYGIDAPNIGHLMVKMGPVFEKLRNRAWMNNPQSQYFDGWPEIARFLSLHLTHVLRCFLNWQEFVKFYIAKDNVLQFRLNSKY